MISFIFSVEIINVIIFAKSEGLVPDPNIFLWIAASVADAASVNPNGIKMLLANVVSTFFIKDNLVFINDPKILPKNPLDCPILCKWVLDSFILAKEAFAKDFRSFETCVLVNNSSYGKLFSSLESLTTESTTTFYESYFSTIYYLWF